MAAKKINSHFSKLISNAADIGSLVEKTADERLRQAGRHASKLMRRNLGQRGRSGPGDYPAKHTGYLQRKTGYQLVRTHEGNYIKVGSKSPHAHLLEFGHGDGKTRNKRPFINRSLDEAQPEVINIMSKRYF